MLGLWQVGIFMKAERNWLKRPWLTPALTTPTDNSVLPPQPISQLCLWLWNDQKCVGHSWRQGALSRFHLSTVIPPLSISSPSLPSFLPPFIVINRTILLSSVMCLNVRGGNEGILSLSSAGFDSACRSNTHFHHPLTMQGPLLWILCVSKCSGVLDKATFVRAAQIYCCHLTQQDSKSTTVTIS